MSASDHTQDFPPVFATNRPDRGETVAQSLRRMLSGLREELITPPDVAIATAYINPGGFLLLADEMEKVNAVRLLLGAEPDPATDLAQTVGSAGWDDKLDAALESHLEWLAAERDLMGFTLEESEAARRMVAWLRVENNDGVRRVEVRRYTQDFLHGKAYIADHATLPAVLAGSSNFTRAGLSLNSELNLGYPLQTGGYVGLVREWFERMWDAADTYPLDEVYAAQWEPHAPWIVFLRMLQELYADSAADEDRPRTELNLTGFQLDGVARMLRLLDRHGGVLVADEVGLGKTFLAGEVIARATLVDRQRVLIVCPAALKAGMWEPFLKQHDFSRRVEVLSYDELRLRSDPEHPDHAGFAAWLDDFALVVIDEAHNLRNPNAQRSEAVNALVAGQNPKRVVLLSATPINNSLMDLQTLVSYFIRDDAAFRGIGIPSIREYIKRAMALDPETLSPEHLFDLMDQVAVRRTRRFVQKHYPGDEITLPNGQTTVIRFPTPKPERIDYALDAAADALLEATIYALDVPDGTPLVSPYDDRQHDPDRLMLARYTPSVYRLDEDLESFQVANSGLLRSALLKRLESCPTALARTLDTLIAGHQKFLEALLAGWVLTGTALREWTGSEDEDLDDYVADLDDAARQGAEPAAEYHAEDLAQDVADDMVILLRLRDQARDCAAGVDLKAERLIDELRGFAEAARRPSRSGVPAGDRRKTIVFSTFADTIDYVAARVSAAVAAAPESDPLSDYQGRVAESAVKGQKTGIDQGHRARVLAAFAPETAGPLNADGTPQAADEYDLLFTTDVLSEGVNLQQAGRIINYDLPWNPMRLVQRHGRVDRIGSKHPHVILGCFFPSENLDALLGLEATLQRKLAYADAAIGAGAVIPGFVSRFEVNLRDTFEQIQQIRDENPELFENRGSAAALSGEEYRRRLAQARADHATRQAIDELPWMSGSGFTNPNTPTSGYVFCIRMGEHTKPWFRFVAADPTTWQVRMLPSEVIDTAGVAGATRGKEVPWVIDDTLLALIAADPAGPAMVRDLPEEAFAGAFHAWEAARDHALGIWLHLTDPVNLLPEVPKALRDAMDLVYAQGADALSHDDRNDLLARLNCSPSARIQRDIRTTLRGDATPPETIREIQRIVIEAGLLPARAPEPLPHLEPPDVHLITWMAVKGRDAL